MRAALVEQFGEACAARHVPMDRFALNVDHIATLSEGGDSQIEHPMQEAAGLSCG